MYTHLFYKDITEDVDSRFDTLGYAKEDASSLPIRRNKKIIERQRKINLMVKSLQGLLHCELNYKHTRS